MDLLKNPTLETSFNDKELLVIDSSLSLNRQFPFHCGFQKKTYFRHVEERFSLKFEMNEKKTSSGNTFGPASIRTLHRVA